MQGIKPSLLVKQSNCGMNQHGIVSVFIVPDRQSTARHILRYSVDTCNSNCTSKIYTKVQARGTFLRPHIINHHSFSKPAKQDEQFNMILYATGFNAFNQLSPVNYVDGEQVLDGRASKHNPQETTHEESIQPDDKKLEPYYAYGYFQNMTLPEDPEDLYDFRPIVEGHQIEPPISGLFYTFSPSASL